jgi:hypothetical protein
VSGTFLVAELELIIPPQHRPSATARHSPVQAALAFHFRITPALVVAEPTPGLSSFVLSSAMERD